MSYFRKNIEKTDGYVPGFQPDGLDVVKLNTNENPYPPSPKVIAAIQSVTPDQLRRYPDPVGNKFREVAAKLNGVDQDNIICTNGGDDFLTIAIRSFCNRDRPLAYPTPTYSLYPVLANIQGCSVLEFPYDDQYNLPDGLFDCHAALIIICNPNAPTTHLTSKDEIAKLADSTKGVVMIDEAYADFADYNCANLVNEFDNIIVLRSMSKGYSLAGLRFGYGIGSKMLINGMLEKVKDSYNVDTISIEAATAAISDQGYFKTNIEKVKQQRKILTNDLRNLGFDIRDSQTNFLLAKNPKGDAQWIFDKLCNLNIFVRYWKYEELKDKLRITVGTEEQNRKLIEALRDILK